jgi:hypothetical protein
VIEMLVEELWLTLIVPVPSKLRPNVEGVVVILQTSGVGVGVGVARGVGLPLASESVSRSGLALDSGWALVSDVGVGDAFGSRHQPDLFRQLYQASGRCGCIRCRYRSRAG